MKVITVVGPATNHNDIKEWCFKNFGPIRAFGGNWGWGNVEYIRYGPAKGKIVTRFHFEREDDAIMFALRWECIHFSETPV